MGCHGLLKLNNPNCGKPTRTQTKIVRIYYQLENLILKMSGEIQNSFISGDMVWSPCKIIGFHAATCSFNSNIQPISTTFRPTFTEIKMVYVAT